MSIADKITQLTAIRGDIRTALADKGVSASDHDYADFATDIGSISTGGDIIQQVANKQNYSDIYTTNGEKIRYVPQNTYYYASIPITSNDTAVETDFSQIQTARWVAKIKLNSLQNYNRFIISGNINFPYPCLLVDSANQLVTGWRKSASTWAWQSLSYTLNTNVWYYAVLYFSQSVGTIISLYDENGNLLEAALVNNSATFSVTSNASIVFGGLAGDSDSSFRYGEINYSETFIEIDGSIVWGKSNSTTRYLGIFDFTDPTKFTKVAYIESTGGAYAEVDFIRNGSTSISCEMEIEPILNATGAVFMGFGVDYANVGGSCALQQYNNKWALLEPGVSYHDFGSISAQKYNITLSLSGLTATLSGDISSSVTSSNFSTSAAFNSAKSRIANSTYGSLRATKYKFRREGTVENSLYACYHTETGIIGFFDETNNNFYQNMGTGTFTKGADV